MIKLSKGLEVILFIQDHPEYGNEFSRSTGYIVVEDAFGKPCGPKA